MMEEHKVIVNNFLNMIIMETQGEGGDCVRLQELFDEYFKEEVCHEDK